MFAPYPIPKQPLVAMQAIYGQASMHLARHSHYCNEFIWRQLHSGMLEWNPIQERLRSTPTRLKVLRVIWHAAPGREITHLAGQCSIEIIDPRPL